MNVSDDRLGDIVRRVEAGEPSATMHLGQLYFKGDGVTQDQEKGLNLMRTSAEAGLSGAQRPQRLSGGDAR